MGRKIISGLLIAFVIAAVVTLALRGREVPPSPVQPTATPTAIVEQPAAASRLVAFYFHGDKRCTSCNAIERLTREALQAEVDAKALEIRSVNVDTPADAHYVEDFQLSMRTVVLAEEAGGKPVRYKRLDECWDRFGDPADFTAYIRASLKDFRAAPAPAQP